MNARSEWWENEDQIARSMGLCFMPTVLGLGLGLLLEVTTNTHVIGALLGIGFAVSILCWCALWSYLSFKNFTKGKG